MVRLYWWDVSLCRRKTKKKSLSTAVQLSGSTKSTSNLSTNLVDPVYAARANRVKKQQFRKRVNTGQRRSPPLPHARWYSMIDSQSSTIEMLIIS